MQHFVNRESELQRIRETMDALHSEQDIAHTPILEFHGVGGIGKTTILKRVEQFCQDRNLPYIWSDASQETAHFIAEMLRQIQRYQVQIEQKNGEEVWHQLIHATQNLLTRRPVVLLIDALEGADQERQVRIAELLSDLASSNRLFIVLASKKKLHFNEMRAVARRLEIIQLKPFDRQNYERYIEKMTQQTPPEISALIFEWTRGYPLAVNTALTAMREQQLNPTQPQDSRRLLSILTEEVIRHGVFSNSIPPGDLEWYQTMLGLFSIARRSILAFMHELVEKFAAHYALHNVIAYMELLPRLNQVADVLTWNHVRAGFAVEPAVRNIFIMKMKLEQEALYYEIHDFLAHLNRHQADEVSGRDRVRYLLDYLYHRAHYQNLSDLPQQLEQIIRLLADELKDRFIEFYEEYDQDNELKLALGEYAATAQSLIYKELAAVHWQLALANARNTPGTEADCVANLQQTFFYLAHNPLVKQIPADLQIHVQQIIKILPLHVCRQVYTNLLLDDRMKRVFDVYRPLFSALVERDRPPGDTS